MKNTFKKYSDALETCNMFAEFFASSYSEAKYDTSADQIWPLQEIQLISFDFVTIEYYITKLKLYPVLLMASEVFLENMCT